MTALKTPRKDSSWSRSLRDSEDGSCDDAAPPPRSRQKRTRTTSSDADAFTWGASTDTVDIGLISEPTGLKFVETPFTLAKRMGARRDNDVEKGGKGGRSGGKGQQPPRPSTSTAPLMPSQEPPKLAPATTTHRTPDAVCAAAPIAAVDQPALPTATSTLGSRPAPAARSQPHSSSSLHIRTDSPSPEIPSFHGPLLRPKAVRPAKSFVSPVRSVKQLPPHVKPAFAPLAAPAARHCRLAFAPAESLAAFRARMAREGAASSASSSTGAAGPTSGGRERVVLGTAVRSVQPVSFTSIVGSGRPRGGGPGRSVGARAAPRREGAQEGGDRAEARLRRLYRSLDG
ncbi:hypothetical protein JCM10450v2_006983 [Rhodotorula kratochvilovae]